MTAVQDTDMTTELKIKQTSDTKLTPSSSEEDSKSTSEPEVDPWDLIDEEDELADWAGRPTLHASRAATAVATVAPTVAPCSHVNK